MAWWQWSRTASANAGADPSINWSEGESPSSINDSARAMMARTAEYRDDTSGLLTTTGTATAYLVTTNQGLNAIPNDGQLLAITPNLTNGASPTLTADGGTTYPIQSSPGIAVASATLVAGTPYTFKFSLSNSAWILRDFFSNPFSVPVGGMIPFVGSVAPNSNFVIPKGQAISRTTYAALFAVCGTTFGVGDGSTTFNIPDLRGKAPVGVDNMGSGASGGYFPGLNTGSVVGQITQTIGTGNLPPYTPSGTPACTGILLNGSTTIGLAVPSSGGFAPGGGPQTGANAASVSATLGTFSFTGNPQGGSSTPLSIVQPTIGMNYIMRIQ